MRSLLSLVILCQLFKLLLEDVNVLDMLSITLIIDGTKKPFEFFSFPIELILPLDFLNPPSTVGAIRFHDKFFNLTILLVDFLQINFYPRAI